MLTLIAVWLGIAILPIIILQYNYSLHLKKVVRQFEQEKEKQKLVTELNMLNNQLNPHFLFNSFNTLLNIIDKDKDLALEYTEKLADFYKEILLIQDKELVLLGEDLLILQNYIYLQQRRLGDCIRLSLEITDEQLKLPIPALTLQLLAENALKHNNTSSDKPLTINIKSEQSSLVISNNINKQEITPRSSGNGLKNIRQRIKLFTGADIQVIQNVIEFKVIIPFKQLANAHPYY